MNQLFSDGIIQAICRTLLYSLAAGAAASVLAAFIIYLTRSARAAYRYNLLILVFMMLVSATGVILFRQIQLAEDAGVTAARVAGGGILTAASSGAQGGLTGEAANGSWLSAVNNFCNRYASFIVLVWFTVILFRTIQLAMSLRATGRLRRNHSIAAPEYWRQWVLHAQTRMGIRRPVLLLQSVQVQTPLTFGTLKPVILVPMGALTGLRPAEVEAVLLHELAHVARRDYLVNILQTAAETLLFFNPGVLWISRLIRDERENCCDDLALSVTGNRLSYVKALVSFQERSLPACSYALAFSGNRMPLLKRAKRILMNRNITLTNMEKLILSAVLVSVCMLIFAFSVKKPGRNQYLNKAIHKHMDTVPVPPKQPGGREANFTLPDNRHYRLVENKEGTHTLYLNGRVVPESEMAQHRKIVKALKQLLRADADIVADDMPADKTPPGNDDLPPGDDAADDIPKGSFIKPEQLAKDLVAEKVITGVQTLASYKFTYNELVVNGTKVTADVHQRLRTKYKVVKGPGHYHNYELPIRGRQ